MIQRAGNVGYFCLVKLIALILLFLAPTLSFAQSCKPRVDSCGIYICEEKKHQCGPQGYPLGFGLKFCQHFLNTEHDYSAASQIWLQKVRGCLMQELVKIDSKADVTCKSMKQAAFQSHVDCYVSTGFCELGLQEKTKIFLSVKSSFRLGEVFKDAIELKQACAARKSQTLVSPSAPQ